jgi:hypothetical protein
MEVRSSSDLMTGTGVGGGRTMMVSDGLVVYIWVFTAGRVVKDASEGQDNAPTLLLLAVKQMSIPSESKHKHLVSVKKNKLDAACCHK